MNFSAADRELYEPLDEATGEIRLLRILPTTHGDDEQIPCQMYKALLPNLRHRFAALSYVWGDAEITKPVLVNGIIMNVTINLADALRTIRRKIYLRSESERAAMEKLRTTKPSAAPHDFFEDLPLWTDALCINQKDIEERSKQVIRMSQIYTDAANVISHITEPPNKKLSMCFPLMRAMGRAYAGASSYDAGTVDSLPGLRCLQDHPEFCRYEKDRRRTSWDALDDFFIAKYWRRVWVNQEVSLARLPTTNVVLCGEEQGSTHDVFMTAQFTQSIRSASPALKCPSFIDWQLWEVITQKSITSTKICAMLYLRSTYQQPTVYHRVMALLALVDAEATDPRDFVYGMLGVIGSESNIVVDYHKPVREVFLDWARWAFASQLSGMAVFLDRVFALAGIGNHTHMDHDLPSWMPCPTRIRCPCAFMEDHDADRQFPSVGRPTVDPSGILSIRGVVCDKIISTAAIMSPLPEKLNDLTNLLKLLCYCVICLMTRCSEKPRMEPVISLFHIMTSTMNKVEGRPDAPFVQAFLTILDEPYLRKHFIMLDNNDLARWLDMCKELPVFRTASGSEVRTTAVHVGIIMATCKRHFNSTFFSTTGGLLGKGPPGLRPGDLVCVLGDCESAVVLRPDGEYWMHIGRCYVPGLSRAELLDDVEGGQRQIRDFLIR